jgi:hypothetical protein
MEILPKGTTKAEDYYGTSKVEDRHPIQDILFITFCREGLRKSDGQVEAREFI